MHTVNGPSRNQPASPRRPIVLRAPDSSSPEVQASAVVAANDDPQTRLLRDEISKLHQTLDHWATAEGEWNHQRRLFQVMTENVSDLIVLLDPQGNRTWNNPAYSHHVGYGPQELAGTNALAEVHPDEKQRAVDALHETLEKGTTTQAEYRVQQKEGGWISLQTENIPILDATGRVETVVLLAADVTEKRKLEEALALASTTATAAGLAEGMARDFDQILTNVVGNLTIAKNLNGPHNAIAVRLNEIERALQRARDLIEQMFSITPETTAPKIRTALEPPVQQAAGEVLRGTMVRAEYLFPRNLPQIDIDEEAFSHAIRNIVTNSVQAMDKGVVRFSAENIPHSQFSYRPDLPLKAGDYLCLHIQDQGHGISEKALPRIFEPYFTTRNARRDWASPPRFRPSSAWAARSWSNPRPVWAPLFPSTCPSPRARRPPAFPARRGPRGPRREPCPALRRRVARPPAARRGSPARAAWSSQGRSAASCSWTTSR